MEVRTRGYKKKKKKKKPNVGGIVVDFPILIAQMNAYTKMSKII